MIPMSNARVAVRPADRLAPQGFPVRGRMPHLVRRDPRVKRLPQGQTRWHFPRNADDFGAACAAIRESWSDEELTLRRADTLGYNSLSQALSGWSRELQAEADRPGT